MTGLEIRRGLRPHLVVPIDILQVVASDIRSTELKRVTRREGRAVSGRKASCWSLTGKEAPTASLIRAAHHSVHCRISLSYMLRVICSAIIRRSSAQHLV